jgi:hypothetical protein
MEADKDSEKRSQPMPTEDQLMTYAKTYIGTYLGVVNEEKPDDLPILAKNAPYDIEIALLPNGCFCLLFQKSNKESFVVTDKNWEYVEGKITSGIDHLVSIFAHEGFSREDAAEKAKKDAMNDVRAMESNEIVQASLHLERIVDELTNVAMSNRASLKSISSQISKLSPLKDSAKRGYPQSEMVRMVQGMKEYPAAPIEIVLDIPDRQMLERISEQIKAASGFIKRIEEQEELIEDIEEKIKKGYDDLSKKIDEKMDHGLAMVLTSADRKIDKGLSTMEESVKKGGVPDESLDLINSQIEDLRKSVASASTGSPLAMEKVKMDLSAGVNEISRKMSEMQMRIEVIEDYLMKISSIMRKRA